MSFYRRGNKYNNRKTYVDGIKFDSQKEANRYKQLKIMESADEIQGLKLQVPYLLIPPQEGLRACSYKADFVYYQDGKEIVEDTKGYQDDAYKIKKKLMKYIYGIDIKET